MKTTLFVSLVALLVSTLALPAQAAEKTMRKRTTVVEVSRGIASEDGGSRFGLGLATFGMGASPSFGLAGDLLGTVSAWYDFNAVHSIQPFAGIPSTSPFNFALGAIYRANVWGDRAAGFHLGGGFNIGVTGPTGATSFFANIFPVGGVHFAVPGATRVQVAFDGGAVFHVTPSPFQFGIYPLSTLLGLSIHYFL